MKKGFILILVFLMSITNVYAADNGTSYETYYSDYGEFSEYTADPVMDDDLTKVEAKRDYVYYNDIPEYGDYYLEGTNPTEYPLINLEDKIVGEFSPWSEVVPTNNLNRVVEARDYYMYADTKEVRYVHVYNTSGSYGALRMTELDITTNGNDINYTISCSSCSDNFSNYIHNGNIRENMSIIYNGGYLKVDLGAYYPLDSLNIQVSLFDQGNDPKTFNMAITRESNLTDTIYAHVSVYSYFRNIDGNDIVPVNYNINNMNVLASDYYDWVRSEEPVARTKTRLVNQFNEYRYQDTKYHYYKLNRVYSICYMSEASLEFPFKYETDYMDFYRYQKRDKLVIANHLDITNKDTKPIDFVLENSRELVIEDTINYLVNGEYPVKYIMGTLVVEKMITVNIAENNVVVEAVKEVIEPVVIPVKEESTPTIEKEVVKEQPIIVKEVIKKQPIVEEIMIKEAPITEIKTIGEEKNDKKKVVVKESNILFLSAFLLLIPIPYVVLKKKKKKGVYNA